MQVTDNQKEIIEQLIRDEFYRLLDRENDLASKRRILALDKEQFSGYLESLKNIIDIKAYKRYTLSNKINAFSELREFEVLNEEGNFVPFLSQDYLEEMMNEDKAKQIMALIKEIYSIGYCYHFLPKVGDHVHLIALPNEKGIILSVFGTMYHEVCTVKFPSETMTISIHDIQKDQ